MLGKILIYISFVSSLISLFGFISASFGKENFVRIGRTFFHITSVSAIVASGYLLYLILTHQFQFAYVWEQSNKELGLSLLISTFYAGQEGSFMLWTFFTVIIGIFLLNYVSKGHRMEPQVMSVFVLVIGFLTLILILKSPFNYLWEAFPKDVETGFVPQDGRGLNPLLHNFWMSIHPPVLFIGFASLAVPFSFAIATLIKNNYKEWIVFSLPWLLFSAAFLGLGIMMGGYWSYGVLGWGGYWAWDPVENSSLIPWIINVAVIHTMLAQKKTGGYVKTNLILSILSFLLVLYSTFLTRSGILGESSVHSFVDPGAEVYIALVTFISFFLILSFIAILMRLKHLKNLGTESNKLLSKESALFIGAIFLCASALIIIAGTSMPIFSKASIDSSFYNKMNLPLAILISFINGISMYLKWQFTGGKQFLKNLIIPSALSVITALFIILSGVKDFLFALFIFSALFAFFVNLEVVFKLIRKNPAKLGASVGHIGLAMLFLGIIASSKFSSEENISLELNKPVQSSLGYTFTYTGSEPFHDSNDKKNIRYYFNVRVEKNNDERVMKPVMYYSEFSKGVMKNPDIANFFTGDLYLSPLGYEQPELFSEDEQIVFNKGETKIFNELNITFENFDFGNLTMGGHEMSTGNYKIGTKLKITNKNSSETIIPCINYINHEPDYEPAKLKMDSNYVFYFVDMKVSNDEQNRSSARIAVVDSRKQKSNIKNETLIINASIKPLIGILWAGTVIIVLGFFISIIRRFKDL